MLFLAEAALGQEHSIVRDDPSLVAPPKGGSCDAVESGFGRMSHLAEMSTYACPSRGPCQPATTIGMHSCHVTSSLLTLNCLMGSGLHSVVARGRLEPDPSRNTTINLDGKPVTVPQVGGRPAVALLQIWESALRCLPS